MFFIVYRYIEIKKYNKKLNILNKELEKLSTIDSLTQIYNRRFLDKSLKTEYDRAKRYKNLFAFILLDIDDFKLINDTYGHDKGDEVLKTISKLLTENSRTNDIVGRWGGEEFMLICPNSSIDGALEIAKKIRLAIEEENFNVDEKVTASFGVIKYDNTKDYHWHVIQVDKALYTAKGLGKNRVEVSK
jgi:polar amino acid transport system substrate-binding protein